MVLSMSMIDGFFMSNFPSKGFFCAVTGAKLPVTCSIEPFTCMASVSISFAAIAKKELVQQSGSAVVGCLGLLAPAAGPQGFFVAQGD